jgi:chromosome segregation ATPase
MHGRSEASDEVAQTNMTGNTYLFRSYDPFDDHIAAIPSNAALEIEAKFVLQDEKITKLSTENEKLQNELLKFEALVDNLKSKISLQSQALQEKENDLFVKDEKIAELTQKIKKQEEDLTEAQANLHASIAESSLKSSENATLANAIKEKDVEMAEKDATIASLNGAVAEKNDEILSLQAFKSTNNNNNKTNVIPVQNEKKTFNFPKKILDPIEHHSTRQSMSLPNTPFKSTLASSSSSSRVDVHRAILRAREEEMKQIADEIKSEVKAMELQLNVLKQENHRLLRFGQSNNRKFSKPIKLGSPPQQSL